MNGTITLKPGDRVRIKVGGHAHKTGEIDSIDAGRVKVQLVKTRISNTGQVIIDDRFGTGGRFVVDFAPEDIEVLPPPLSLLDRIGKM